MPTLKTLMSAPVTSPLTEVDLEDVGLFLIQLTSRGFLQSKDQTNLENCHDSIAYSICNHIIAEPMSFHVKQFIKFLNSLQISTDDVTKLKEFKALYQQMVEPIKEKLAIKALEKFGKTVELCLAQIPNNDTLEEEVFNCTEAEQTNMNNTTKLFRKRALFSQTCNTLLETEENIAAQESPIPQASIKDLVNQNQGGNSSSDDNDSDVGQVKATPPQKASKTTKRKKTNNKESSCSDSDGRKRRPKRILVDEN